MDVPKKYWWVVGLAVPILVAVIGIFPKLISNDGKDGKSFNVDVVGTQFNGEVSFNSTTITIEQIRQELGNELPTEMIKTLQKAMDLVDKNNFTDAIPLFESVVESVPVPAVLNNLGAAYLASGNKKMAMISFDRAISIEPDQETVNFNLRQAKSEIHESISNNVQLSGSPEIEPNNTIIEANPFIVGQIVNAEISSNEDLDYFKFHGNFKLRDKIKITLENRSITLKPHIKVYNENKSEFYSNYDITSGANLDFVLLMEPRTDYYIQIFPYNASHGKYNLSVIAQQSFDSHEPNNDQFSATRIVQGKIIKSNIMDAKDADWYQISEIDTEEVIVKMENKSTTLKPLIKVYDNNMSEILSHYSNTFGAHLEFVFNPQPGLNYYFQILQYNNTYGEYWFSIQ